MEVTVAKTKAMVNATALGTQQECEAIQAKPISNTQELVQSRIKLGLSQNIAYVNANSTELVAGARGPPQHSLVQRSADGAVAAGRGPQAGNADAQSDGSAGGTAPATDRRDADSGPQQLVRPMQQLSQPLQQLTSMLGGGGKGGADGAGAMPFSSFSNHPRQAAPARALVAAWCARRRRPAPAALRRRHR
jgi:hypothetical protein